MRDRDSSGASGSWEKTQGDVRRLMRENKRGQRKDHVCPLELPVRSQTARYREGLRDRNERTETGAKKWRERG